MNGAVVAGFARIQTRWGKAELLQVQLQELANEEPSPGPSLEKGGGVGEERFGQ